jgi:hypothetical protein
MFALNLGYRWNLASTTAGIHDVIYLPQGNSRPRLQRAPRTEAQGVLFDPQLYLAGLDAEQCTKACVRLASFPWFGVNELEAFDSGTGKLTDWEAASRAVIAELWTATPPDGDNAIATACRDVIEFQVGLGCSAIILPSPLITEREDEAQVPAQWLDAAVEAARELEVGQPLLASVALTETVLNDSAFLPAGFLDTVVDQVSSRPGIDGVYIVIAQIDARHPFQTDARVYRAYLHLCRAFAYLNYDTILTNFADVFGLVCLGVGATGLATGQSHALRRLALSGLEDEGFGKALPHLYSHRAVAEFLSESHLGPIAATRLLRPIRDTTRYSAALMGELARGGSASNLPRWAESQNNNNEASKHFLNRIASETEDLLQGSLAEREERVRAWLEDADANRVYLERRLSDAGRGHVGRFAASGEWLQMFDALTA